MAKDSKHVCQALFGHFSADLNWNIGFDQLRRLHFPEVFANFHQKLSRLDFTGKDFQLFQHTVDPGFWVQGIVHLAPRRQSVGRVSTKNTEVRHGLNLEAAASSSLLF